MRTVISARHDALEPALRDRAERVLERLAAQNRSAVEGAAVFDRVAGTPWAELRVHCTGGHTFLATGEGAEHRTALVQAEDRLRRQLRRLTTMRQARRHPTDQ